MFMRPLVMPHIDVFPFKKRSSAIVVSTLLCSMSLQSEVITYSNGSGNRLDAVTHGDGTTVDYVYDAAGNLISKTVTLPSTTPTEGDDTLTGTNANDVIDALGGNDTVDGGEGNDRLLGRAGDDHLMGGVGNDQLRGGTGSDVLDGGTGNDWAQYNDSSAGVTIDLAAGTASGGDAAGDVLTNIEYLLGSPFDDVLTGDNVRNVIYGGDGNDSINGLGGNDVLRGDDGADALDGGTGNDWANYTNSPAGVSVSLETGTGTGSHAEGDTLTNIEYLHGSNHNDTLTGDGNRNVIYGRTGDDALNGLAGNDTLRGDAGADALDGGTGIDWAYYTNSPTGVDVNLTTGVGANGDAAGDTLTNIERIYGSNHADVLTGDALANTLYGRDGDDTLNGAGGNDILRGDAGADAHDGGDGNDWVYYTNSAAGVTVNLALNTATGGDATGDTFTSIERVHGSNHDDSITGDGANNSLYGRTGDDSLIGGNGNDVLRGDGGADALDGGDGFDWAFYQNSPAGVQVDLSTGLASGGHAEGDTLANIERIHGSNHNDTLTGDANRNYLYGRTGDDTLSGGDENDVLRGDAGADAIDGGNGNDWAHYINSNAGVHINLALGTASGGHAQGDVLSNIEYVHGSNHDDTLTGDGVRNVLYGRLGNDVIIGGGGNDTLRGDAGNDTVQGGPGNDNYLFRPQHGIDTINNVESDNATAADRLLFSNGIDEPLDIWLTRVGDNLVIDVVATSDQVIIVDWYQGGELDEIRTGSARLRQGNVDTLVSAMSAYAVPSGSVPQNVQDDLAPTIASTWE